VSQKLRSNVHAVGDSTVDLLHCGVNAQIAPDDNQAIKDLNYASKVLAEKVMSVCLFVCFFNVLNVLVVIRCSHVEGS